ncbi:MAG: polyprenyl synthetase family protein [bacterium]|jgi:geranylgeranyl diphosphate synthase type II|nr:polyprenyl synthetase family protein [bacterium]
MDLKSLFSHSVSRVEAYLRQWLPPPKAYPPVIHEAIHYSLFSGGKRFRPTLVLAGGHLFEVDDDKLLPVACAVELIHTYSLIHDDLPCMDDDDLRRGKPTCHKKYGEAVAILAGDALLTAAFETLVAGNREQKVPPAIICVLVERLAMAAGSKGLVGGQIVDILSEGKEITLPEVQFIHSHKTGELIRFCAAAGAIVAGAPKEDICRMERFGGELGLLFQVKDDLLDEVGSTVKLGKVAGADQRRSKSTYPRVIGVKESRCVLEALRCRTRDELAPYGEAASELLVLADFVAKREH